MHPHEQLIHTFYQAFQRGDGEAMAACYHPEARFTDPVFRNLLGSEPGDMWRMLTARARDFSLVYDQVRADDRHGSAHWVATYTFSQTGNTVVNDILAAFTFRDGLILTHTDRFDLWKWAGQALGLKGRLLGWTPLVQGAIRRQAARGLAQFRAGRSG